MSIALFNASKRQLNRLLTRAFTRLHAGIKCKQGGAVMLEALVAVSAAGVVTGSTLHLYTQAQHKALATQVSLSASAFASALNLQHAAMALNRGAKGLGRNSAGLIVDAGDTSAMTDRGCELLWSALVVSASPSPLNTAAAAGWQSQAQGDSCVYTYTEQAVGSRAFRYSAATGQVTLLAAKHF